MIDDHLGFADHLKYIITKISRRIGIMARTIKFVNKNYKIKVYNIITAFCILPFNIISFKHNANAQTTKVTK